MHERVSLTALRGPRQARPTGPETIRATPWVLVAAVLVAGVLSACAAKAPPALPTTLAYPDLLYPNVPAALTQFTPQVAAAVERGWRQLQSNNITEAEREFAGALRRAPAFYPAATARE